MSEQGGEGHRAEIRFWGNPSNERYVVLCHVDGCGWRSRGGLSAEVAGRLQMTHWRTSLTSPQEDSHE